MRAVAREAGVALGLVNYYFEDKYTGDVLQRQDTALAESVRRGMRTAAFDQGRIVHVDSAPGLCEHGVRHFHGLLIDAYRTPAAGRDAALTDEVAAPHGGRRGDPGA